MNLTRDQIVRYWQKRIEAARVNWGESRVFTPCPLHDSKTGTPLTIFLDGNSGFNCNGCGRKGNLFQFESMFTGCTVAEAEQQVSEITGAQPKQMSSGLRHIASYDYRDIKGALLYQKRRYVDQQGKKTFLAFRPNGKGGWESRIDPEGGPKTKRVLYNLGHVVTANLVLVAEGEKDCDTLTGLSLYSDIPELRVAATTNHDGAWQPGQSANWLPEYNPSFANKGVVIFQDNDVPGETWAQYVAASVKPYAAAVKIVKFPELPEKGDVTDWIEAGHTAAELQQLINATPEWQPLVEEVVRRVFVSAYEFTTTERKEISWLVEGAIQKGANGFIVGLPGASKSFITEYMALCLALGVDWLGCKVPKPIKVGFCARQDAVELTDWRFRTMLLGLQLGEDGYVHEKAECGERYKTNLWINTREQTPQLLLDDEAQLQELISGARERELQLLFLDVFNILHTANMNKAEEMLPILDKCSRIQREAGCAVGVVHHYNKQREGSVTERTLGSSAIGGFAEWMIGVEKVGKDGGEWIRRVSFEKVKAGKEGEPIEFFIDNRRKEYVLMQVLEADEQKTPLQQDTERKCGKAQAGGDR